MRRTTLCYIERDGRYLMLHRTRKANDANHDKWLGVGGGIEPGETTEACLLREVKEETGLTLTNWAARGLVHFRSNAYEDEEMYLYTADGFCGTLRPCDEGDLAWVNKEEVPSLNLWEGDRIFLELIRTDHAWFDLTLYYDGDRLARAELDDKEIPLPPTTLDMREE